MERQGLYSTHILEGARHLMGAMSSKPKKEKEILLSLPVEEFAGMLKDMIEEEKKIALNRSWNFFYGIRSRGINEGFLLKIDCKFLFLTDRFDGFSAL